MAVCHLFILLAVSQGLQRHTVAEDRGIHAEAAVPVCYRCIIKSYSVQSAASMAGTLTNSCRRIFELQVLMPHEGPGAEAALVQLQSSLKVQHALQDQCASVAAIPAPKKASNDHRRHSDSVRVPRLLDSGSCTAWGTVEHL